MKKIVILGAGGLGREVADVIRAINAASQPQWDIVGFIDQNPAIKGRLLTDIPVLGGFDWLDGVDTTDMHAVCGVGSPVSKRRLVAYASERGLHFPNLVHPSAILTEYVAWGSGIVITAGTILTNTITLGNHVLLNLATTVGHDAILGDYCNVAPGVHISGNVHLEEGCDIGTGSSIIQGVSIGHWTIVGAGSVLVRDAPANTTVVGIPARVIKERAEGWHLDA